MCSFSYCVFKSLSSRSLFVSSSVMFSHFSPCVPCVPCVLWVPVCAQSASLVRTQFSFWYLLHIFISWICPCLLLVYFAAYLFCFLQVWTSISASCVKKKKAAFCSVACLPPCLAFGSLFVVSTSQTAGAQDTKCRKSAGPVRQAAQLTSLLI